MMGVQEKEPMGGKKGRRAIPLLLACFSISCKDTLKVTYVLTDIPAAAVFIPASLLLYSIGEACD